MEGKKHWFTSLDEDEDLTLNGRALQAASALTCQGVNYLRWLVSTLI